MISLIFGENTFFSYQKLRQIIKERQKFFGNKFSLLKLDGKKLEFSDLVAEIRNKNLFSQIPTIIIEEVFSNQKFKEDFVKNIDEFLNQDVLIIFYQKGSISKEEEFFKILQKKAKIYEFLQPTPFQVQEFILKFLSKKGFKITPSACKKLIDFIQKDLWRLYLELQKLIAFKREEKIIRESDVDLLVRPEIDVSIFATIDALGQKNKKLALKLIYNHLKKGDSPLYLLSMIKYQFRNLLIVKEKEKKPNFLKEISKEFNPFVLKKMQRQSYLFTLDQLKKFYQKIFKIELLIKKGRITPQEGLELLVLDL